MEKAVVGSDNGKSVPVARVALCAMKVNLSMPPQCQQQRLEGMFAENHHQ